MHCCFLSMDDLAGYVSDDELAIEPLRKLGWNVETVSWRDKTIDWNDYEAVIIRTTWDYQKYPQEFLSVLREIDKSKARLENPLKIVEWNLSKTYLRELENKGVKIVPTVWANETPSEMLFQNWLKYFETDQIVVKPVISATAEFTYRLREYAPELADIFANRKYMIQPFMPKIVAEGEYSLFYFGGEYSHAILKSPKTNDFRVQEEHGGNIQPAEPTEKLLETARQVFRLIESPPLYARIDFVRDSNDDFCLMELELIEPALYFRMNADAPRNFARIFSERMNG